MVLKRSANSRTVGRLSDAEAALRRSNAIDLSMMTLAKDIYPSREKAPYEELDRHERILWHERAATRRHLDKVIAREARKFEETDWHAPRPVVSDGEIAELARAQRARNEAGPSPKERARAEKKAAKRRARIEALVDAELSLLDPREVEASGEETIVGGFEDGLDDSRPETSNVVQFPATPRERRPRRPRFTAYSTSAYYDEDDDE